MYQDSQTMNKEKVKLIIKDIESLVQSLKSEVYSDPESYQKDSTYEHITNYLQNYEEVFYDGDDDGYPD